MLNHIVVMGRLTHDPEMRRTADGVAVTSFSVAVERDHKSAESSERETDFIDCVAWRQAAEFVSKYFTKGSMAIITGRLQIRSWTDKEGNKRRTAEIVAKNVYFGSTKRDGTGAKADRPASAAPAYGNGAYPDTMAYLAQLQGSGNYGSTF